MYAYGLRSTSDYEMSLSQQRKTTSRQRHYSAQESRKSRRSSHETSSGYETMQSGTGSSRSNHNLKLNLPEKPEYQPVEFRSPPPKYEDICPSFVDLSTQDHSSNSDDFIPTSHYHSTSTQRPHSRRFHNSSRGAVVQVQPKMGKNASMRFYGRSDRVNAPDILCLTNFKEGDPDSTRPLKINDETVDYEMFQLATREEAQNALIDYAKSKFLLRHKEAKRMEIVNIHTWCAFRYKLSTFTEQRHFCTKKRPYKKDEQIDKCLGTQLNLWNVEVKPPVPYYETYKIVKVPHSEKVICCNRCSGSGRATCRTCSGSGEIECRRCNGNSSLSSYVCHCHAGSTRCGQCGGLRTETCIDCEGSGKNVSYKELEVRWAVEESTYVDGHPELQRKHLLSEKGRAVYRKHGKKLEPLEETDILHKNIRRFSKMQLENHNWSDRINLKQKHKVEIVPVHVIDCVDKGKQFRFYLIGLDRKVYAPNYPGKRLGGCNLSFFGR